MTCAFLYDNIENMEKEKSILAQNITTLRKTRKLTQSELAESLNYSDKTISKWENDETSPDIHTLIMISEFFGVTLDELCKKVITIEDAQHAKKKENFFTKFTRNKIVITCISVIVVWFIATLVYIGIKLGTGISAWMSFIWAVPASFIVLIIFFSIWGNKNLVLIASSFFVWTFLMAIHLQLIPYNIPSIWLVYCIGVPIQFGIILSFLLKRHKNKKVEQN